MESKWTNKYVIKSDLYKAQGKIPCEVSGTITTTSQPPKRIIFEENEMEPFGSCHYVEFQSGPDIPLIRQMIKETNSYQDNICNPVKVIEIEKPYLPNSKLKLKVNKQKTQRNVAIASLLEILSKDGTSLSKQGEEVESPNGKHLKLLKPEDFISKTQSVCGKCGNVVVNLCECVYNETEKENSFDIKIKGVNGNTKTELKSFGVYKPSSMADLYYKQYVERSKHKELRRVYYETEIEKTLEKLDIPGLEVVGLPQHRHLLSDDCTVCKVLYKKFVNEDILIEKK